MGDHTAAGRATAPPIRAMPARQRRKGAECVEMSVVVFKLILKLLTILLIVYFMQQEQ
jgi:hypothetical protein